MYPRNNATPRPITVGAVVQISDGAVQTTGASVEISKDGGAFSAGGGTLDVSNGIHSYTPTQSETDCDSLRINVYKSGCIPVTAQAVFSASSSFGYAGTDQAKIANPTSTVNLSGTTIKAVTDGVTVAANNDKTGYSLVQAFPTNFAALSVDSSGRVLLQPTQTGVTIPTVTQLTNAVVLPSSATIDITGSITGNITGNLSGSVGSVTGNVGGNVTGSVGSISGVTFPTNFDALGINSSGHVSRVVLVDTTTTNTDMRGTDGAALATHWTSTRAGYLDGVLLAANFSNRTVQVTGVGSGHIAADVHSLQPAVINNTHFAPGAIDDNALAASAATEVATAVGTLQVLTDLVTMIINDGTANARFSTSALQNAPSGGGGGGSTTVNVLPYTGAVPDRVEGTTIKGVIKFGLILKNGSVKMVY